MYLSRRTYVKNWDHRSIEEKWEITIKRGGKIFKGIDPKKISGITEDVAYWRKANAIHKWFVDNTQDGIDDCRDSYVHHEQLMELVAECKKALKDRDKASEILPIQEGFFFGGKEYDDYYFEQLEDTVKELENLDDKGEYYYHSSW